jgi:Cof subfamily protein (haloacid dehalogenase superfamily)
MYRAVMLDLDGTLLDARGQVSPRAHSAISTLQHRGVRVMVATGRCVATARQAISGLTLETELACYNGGVMVDPRDGRWLRHIAFETTLGDAVVSEALATGLDLIVHHEDRKWVPPVRHAVMDRLLERSNAVHRVTDASELPVGDITRVSMIGDQDLLYASLARISERLGAVEMYPYALDDIPCYAGLAAHFADIHPASRGKAEGLDWLEQHYGIARHEVVAFGDHFNDQPMLTAAGLGVAMANAPAEIRALAQRIAPHHDDDGVARVLEELFQLRH